MVKNDHCVLFLALIDHGPVDTAMKMVIKEKRVATKVLGVTLEMNRPIVVVHR